MTVEEKRKDSIILPASPVVGAKAALGYADVEASSSLDPLTSASSLLLLFFDGLNRRGESLYLSSLSCTTTIK